jgi:hypothetical protein
MSSRIRAIPETSVHDLRQLVVDSIDQIVAAPQLLDAELPWEGGPLLVIDARQQPVLISFDVRDACRALFNGLAALDAFESSHALLVRLLPELTDPSITGTPRLVVLVTEAPPALTFLARMMPQLEVLTFRVLEINHQTGLFIEPIVKREAEPPHVDVIEGPEAQPFEPQTIPFPERQAELTEQENAYFRYL